MTVVLILLKPAYMYVTKLYIEMIYQLFFFSTITPETQKEEWHYLLSPFLFFTHYVIYG